MTSFISWKEINLNPFSTLGHTRWKKQAKLTDKHQPDKMQIPNDPEHICHNSFQQHYFDIHKYHCNVDNCMCHIRHKYNLKYIIYALI